MQKSLFCAIATKTRVYIYRYKRKCQKGIASWGKWEYTHLTENVTEKVIGIVFGNKGIYCIIQEGQK